MRVHDPHAHHMQAAFRLAVEAAEAGEVPVGAVIIHEGRPIARSSNQVELLKDPTAHAEILAITQAAATLGDWRLEGCTLYVTKEPCPMCAGAIVQSRIPTVVFGVDDPARGGAVSRFRILDTPELNHRCEVISGVMEVECRELLQGFFREKRSRQDPPDSPS